ncbi:MAG: Extracellular solute-binding protein, partial [Parcubacteria group bacterium GW2011_GWB1_41_4]
MKLSFKRLISGFLGLGLRDKIIFSFLIIAGTIGLSLFSARFYFSNTVLIPESGGVYTEAVISFPRYVNPVIPDQNNAEEILESLVFSSLYKPDGQGGVLPDLAESMTLFEEGKVFLVSLRENIFWHDGEPLTARDVIFTLELLKNQELQNPLADF